MCQLNPKHENHPYSRGTKPPLFKRDQTTPIQEGPNHPYSRGTKPPLFKRDQTTPIQEGPNHPYSRGTKPPLFKRDQTTPIQEGPNKMHNYVSRGHTHRLHLPTQRTPASSSWTQLCTPRPSLVQLIRALSVPVQASSSSSIWPDPCPKYALRRAVPPIEVCINWGGENSSGLSF